MWNNIFPGKAYNYGIMKNLIYDLNKLSESYLSHINFTSSMSFDRHLIKELLNKQAYGVLNTRLKGFAEKNESVLSNSPDYFYNKSFY